jgi:squalene-associated FAD-dependent desaturase
MSTGHFSAGEEAVLRPSAGRKSAPRLAIVGGGLAGLSAAVAAVERGFQVELFEQARRLGGRAGSFHVGQVTGLPELADGLVDYCPHVALGCCTNLADFCRRAGVADCFRRYRTLHFFGPTRPQPPVAPASQYDFTASRWLPAPLHLLPGLMRLGYLTRPERRSIARAMLRLARQRVPADGEETIGQWLGRQGQSAQTVERFWSVVLVSALGETVDRASFAASQKVFVDGFLGSRRAYELEVAGVPLGEVWQRVGKWLSRRGVLLHLGAHVDQISGDHCRARELVLRDGARAEFDFVIAAIPWRHASGLLAPPLLKAVPMLDKVSSIEPVPITAVHVWFDRPVSDLPHAALVGRLSQWIFNMGSAHAGALHHYAVVISASRGLAGRNRQDVLEEVCCDVESIWPAARDARLRHSRVLTQPAAVFAALPGLDRLRPAQQTPVQNLLLAGDWTETGWPATMEGAVRSGYLAAEAMLRSLGRQEHVLVPDLPRGWLARRVIRG